MIEFHLCNKDKSKSLCIVLKFVNSHYPYDNSCYLCSLCYMPLNLIYFIVSKIIKMLDLRVRAVFHKTVRVWHVYNNFKIGFTCRITVIFGTLKIGSLLINTLVSSISFSYKNMFQNGVDALSKIVHAFW